eukprot:784967-Rhodomonas_salina.5
MVEGRKEGGGRRRRTCDEAFLPSSDSLELWGGGGMLDMPPGLLVAMKVCALVAELLFIACAPHTPHCQRTAHSEPRTRHNATCLHLRTHTPTHAIMNTARRVCL